jgi:hypothetical protein
MCHAAPPPRSVRARHSADQKQPSSSTPGVKTQKRGTRSSSCALVDPSLKSKEPHNPIHRGSCFSNHSQVATRRKKERRKNHANNFSASALDLLQKIHRYIHKELRTASASSNYCCHAALHPSLTARRIFVSEVCPLLISRQNSIFGATHSGNHEVN